MPQNDIAAHAADLPYEAAFLFWRTVTNIFFREIRPRALVVHRETGRKTQFLVAASSMQRKFIGFFARIFHSIPVVRAMDHAKVGTGLIFLSEDDPCLVEGYGTNFLEELAPRSQIVLPKSMGSLSAEVTEVLSGTRVRIKKEFGGDKTTTVREQLSQARANGAKGVTFRRVPHIDQQEVYQHVYDGLKNGGCIVIFPEGGSHDRTHLLPLKAGVSLMALGAMANHPELKVKIVPVGLSYFHAHKFRSRAVVEFGTPMDVPDELVGMFKQGGPSKRDATAQLLELIHDALKSVTIRAPDFDTLMVIQAARRLYRAPGQEMTLGQVVEMNRRFLEAYERFKDDPKIIKLREDVTRYNRLLRDIGLRDHQVPRAEKSTWKILGLLSYRMILLLAWTTLALPGVILNGPIFILASIISHKKAKQALAASNVKIAGRDVLATWKILISLGAAPVLYVFYAFLATWMMIKAGAPMRWRIWTPFIVMSVLPVIAYAALKFGEAGADVLKSLRPLIIALVPGQQRFLTRAKETRERLTADLAEVVNEFGPKLYDDFDQWRMVPPSSKPPPLSLDSLDSRRTPSRSNAQGLLLSHPMTWLDEKLFGWSTTSKRGTSAWTGSTSPSTRAGTPETLSDNEDEQDEPDYDDLLHFLDSKSPNTGRSRTSSYADLQKLRNQTSARVTTIDTAPRVTSRVDLEVSPVSVSGDGVHLRHGERVRKLSLTDGVSVKRIGKVNRRASFEEATAELNREIRIRRSSHGHEE
ncbi:glycerol-3-phosphate O-acyltransferase [Panus rudis PR-1116 ss-1]|nr:glycerol-3-phosphate O-acyltransferase [Panus rudis PR-1116 ss-1]